MCVCVCVCVFVSAGESFFLFALDSMGHNDTR